MTSTQTKMVPWPNLGQFIVDDIGSLNAEAFEHQMYLAALARLKMAVKALHIISGEAWADEDGIFRPMLRSTRKTFADKALALIGDLPPEVGEAGRD